MEVNGNLANPEAQDENPAAVFLRLLRFTAGILPWPATAMQIP